MKKQKNKTSNQRAAAVFRIPFCKPSNRQADTLDIAWNI